MANFDFSTGSQLYTPPTGNAVNFNFTPAPVVQSEITIAATTAAYDRGDPVQAIASVPYGVTEASTASFGLPYGMGEPLHLIASLPYGVTNRADSTRNINYANATPADVVTDLPYVNIVQRADITYRIDYASGTPADVVTDLPYLLPVPSMASFSLNQGQADRADANTLLEYGTGELVRANRSITWGYGLNNFLIGGVTTLPSDVEIEPPPEPIHHIAYEVFTVVNNVTITVRPDNTGILFDNLTLSRDIESFAWVVNFDVYDTDSFNRVRPQGRTIKTIDVLINGTTFTFFIGKTNTTRSAAQDGTVTKRHRCTGWSSIKLLSFPYAGRRSFTATTAQTAAQTVQTELGQSVTVTWNAPDWTLQPGIHTYQGQTPLGAALQVINSIGAVISPATTGDAVTVTPYFPVSPWNWDNPGTFINRTMSEAQFFSIDNDTVPRDNPNGVFVYGEDVTNGVGVRALRSGKPASNFLPDVVNRYMTAVNAAQERGRIEVARNSFIEEIPMSTYIDENGIIMPQELIEFTELDGVTKWRGMVISTSVSCARVGTALTQTLTVVRFFDG